MWDKLSHAQAHWQPSFNERPLAAPDWVLDWSAMRKRWARLISPVLLGTTEIRCVTQLHPNSLRKHGRPMSPSPTLREFCSLFCKTAGIEIMLVTHLLLGFRMVTVPWVRGRVKIFLGTGNPPRQSGGDSLGIPVVFALPTRPDLSSPAPQQCWCPGKIKAEHDQ